MKKCYMLLMSLLFVCGTAYGQAGPRLIINEFLADPAADVPGGDANGDGERHAQLDEFVELANVSRDTMDLTGWRVGDDERVNFMFPDGYRLPPKHFVVLFGGGDVSNVPGYDADPMMSRVISLGDSVGNGLANGGEAIVLLSPDGTEDLFVAYGSVATAGGPSNTSAVGDVTFEYQYILTANAGADASVTLSPDGNPDGATAYVVHNTVSSANFSPGTAINGAMTVPKILPPITLVINEVLADPNGSAPTDLSGDANADGIRDAAADEFVELANVSDAPVDLSGFTIGDDESFVAFTFPDGYMLGAREFVTVFGGGNVSNVPGYDIDRLQTRVFVVDSLQNGLGNGMANGGDALMVLSPDGKYDMYFAYGSRAGLGPVAAPEGVDFEFEWSTSTPGNGNQSMTRFPDGNTSVEDPYVLHGTASESVFSPNQTVDGRSMVPGPTPPVTVVINEVYVEASADANGDGVTDAMQDQFIELANTSETESVDLSGFMVGDPSGTTFTFPQGYVLAPLQFVAVFGGGDVSGLVGYNADPMQTKVFAASGMLGNGLDQDGDYAVLLSDDGDYDAYVAYGTATETGDPSIDGMPSLSFEFMQKTAALAPSGVSITRFPDGDYLSPDPFVAHTNASDLPYSPAMSVEGLGGIGEFVDVPHPWGTGYGLHFRRFERDRVEVRNASSELPLRLEEGTIEFWFRPDSVITHNTHQPDWTYLIGKNQSGATAAGDLGIAWPRGHGNIQTYINDAEKNQDEVFSSSNDKEVFYPRWYHLALSWKMGDSLRLFIDGELRDETTSTMPLLAGDQPIFFGNGSYNGLFSALEGFPGMMDEVRLSATQRYTEGFDLQTAPFAVDGYTIGLWHFDEGEGDVAANAVAEDYLVGYLGGLDALDQPDPASKPDWINIRTLVGNEQEELPEGFALEQNYPNPFSPSTTFGFMVPHPADVEIAVYDVLGRRVQVLLNEHMEAGKHTVHFESGALASGLYFYVLSTPEVRLVRKMTLVK